MLTAWPYPCPAETNGTRIYCAAGTPDGVYGEPLLDGMRYVGVARREGPEEFFGAAGVEVSASSDPLLATPMTGGVSVPLVIPAQCRPYDLLVGWDSQGMISMDAVNQQINFWLFPVLDGVPILGATPLWQSTQLLIGVGVPCRQITQVQMHAAPQTIANVAAGVAKTVECKTGCYFAAGAPDGVARLDKIVSALRVYIQWT